MGILLELSEIELQALSDALLFTEENSDCVSDAHLRMKERIRKALAVEAWGK